jgi:hypothetical protein
VVGEGYPPFDKVKFQVKEVSMPEEMKRKTMEMMKKFFH